MNILRQFLILTVFSGWAGMASAMPIMVGVDVEVSGASFSDITMPSFASVPQVGSYELLLFDDVLLDFTFESLLVPGEVFNFAPGGVDRFRITGINESLMLDPLNPLAFPLGLSLINIVSFPDVNIDPIVVNVGRVPLPATLALFVCGLAGLGWARRKSM